MRLDEINSIRHFLGQFFFYFFYFFICTWILALEGIHSPSVMTDFSSHVGLYNSVRV
jgi:hypothetical protein